MKIVLATPLRVLACMAVGPLAAGIAWPQQGGITTGAGSQRPISVRGNVAVEGGLTPPGPIEIELVCQGQAQPQGKTDAKGSFLVDLGANRFQGASSASVGSSAAGSGFGGALSGQTQVDGMSVLSMMGCSLRAVLAGYRSDQADLSRLRVGEAANVGTIFLHKLGDAGGVTVSATSLSAPRDAQRAYAAGRNFLAKQRVADAQKEFAKAVEVYPQYAEAWQDLGAVLQSQNKPAEARKAYLGAITADPKFVRPYLSLARLSAVERNWKDVLEKTAALRQLSPDGYPQAFYYSAVAHYNLNNNESAFADAQQAVKLDTAHAVPLAEQLLGVLYSERGDHKSAAEQFRGYIQHVPPGTNVDAVKALLAEAEKRASESGK
jgi:tetratricopeptide (TPR) repeat protein